MPQQTLQRLIQGDGSIVEYYKNAQEIWGSALSAHGSDVEALAARLPALQFEFERRCGGRWLGQEIMAVVGIGQYYDGRIGFEGTLEDVSLVRDALLSSMCSVEVKYHAKAVAEVFGLDGDIAEGAKR